MSGQIVDEEYECVVCYRCHMKFWMPTFVFKTAQMLESEFTWFCPAGHEQHFVRNKDDEKPAGGGEVVSFKVFDGGLKS